MVVNSCEEGQDAYSISVLPDEVTADTQCESQFAFLRHFKVSSPLNSQMCLDAQLNCQTYINPEMRSADTYSPCVVDVDFVKENSGTPKTNDEAVDTLKTEGPLTRSLQSQISLQMGDKLMQLLMNDSFVLPKFTSRDKHDKHAAERVHETPTNRMRKYKRSTSFNSRKVVVLFSVLSSMGTMILIYLTLRVRQIGDGSFNV